MTPALSHRGSIQKEEFMPTQSKPAAPIRISLAMQRCAAIPLRAIAGGGFIQHGWAKIVNSDSAGPARSLPASVSVPHDFGRVTGRSSASFRRICRMGKRSDDRGPANRDFYGPSPLRLQLHQNQSDRGWPGAIRISGVRMRPSLYRVHPGSRVAQSRPVVH
jgi:hypothetical protein